MAQLVTIDQVRKQIDDQSTDNTVELTLYIEAATDAVERHTGPIITREVTEQVNACGIGLPLTRMPVVGLTSITPALAGGLAVNVEDLTVDAEAGVLYRLDGGAFSGGPWTVTYTAGRGDSVPPTVQLATLLLIQHLWSTKYGASRGQGPSMDYSVNEPMPGFGYAIPNRVLTLLEPYQQPFGFA
ncbi:hypothetical protein OG693_39685 (plasmid) [Streptomyces sp. NBC_01259]|uniref:hypothetical protein n=1 Tax=Streptomyces sp. NBC_01259 TaxID=2903800 RepID=UPI002F90C80C